MKLKEFLKVCNCRDCIFGVYDCNNESPIEEIENVKETKVLEKYFDSTVSDVWPYNENKIVVNVYIG